MTWTELDDEELSRRINTLIMRGLSARAAVTQARAEQRRDYR
jgi:hypothetical protein